jgi:hypothetical protein
MSRVVHLHIGAPKTGTTYLQDRLMVNAAMLAQHGVHFPTKNRITPADLFHFRAALDLLERDWGGEPGHAKGAWDTMVRRVRRADGNVVISHEILAPARTEQVHKAVNDLSGTDVHVVYSARDLARQLPAAWQESIKQGRSWSFARFLDKFEKGGTWFHRALDLPRVLSTWGQRVPPENIHLVTVPHERGPGGDLLWQRFCTAFQLDPEWAPKDSERSNASLGVAETQLIRQLNKDLDIRVGRGVAYDQLIRQLLAQEVLVSRKMLPVRLPPERYDWVEAQSERWVEWVKASGIHVIGDVDELRPRRPAPDTPWHDPDHVRPKQQLGAALDALAAVTREAAEREQASTAGRLAEMSRRLRIR